LLRDDFPDVRLEVAGSGPERVALEREVASLGIDNHVKFLGWQTDLTSALARWDVFALPSLEEGFGIAALEAMAAGLPIVATSVGGIPELIEDGRTGWLVPPGNSKAFAGRLRELILSPQQRLSMGNVGRVRARQYFSSEVMVESISKIYDTILNRVPTGNEA
jgi:glycosyltransferase involved in cell wall biosynthesis